MHGRVEVLDRVGRAESAIEGAGDAEALEGQGLGEPFPQRGGRARMRALEAQGALREATFGERRILKSASLFQRATGAGPHGP